MFWSLLIFFYISCQTDTNVSENTSKSSSQTVSTTDDSPSKKTDPPSQENTLSKETPSQSTEATNDTPSSKTEPSKSAETPSEGLKIKPNMDNKATNDIGPKEMGSEHATGNVFIGYNNVGKKGSLPKNCALCRRYSTDKEKKFSKDCSDKGGTLHACYCITQLCSVKIR